MNEDLIYLMLFSGLFGLGFLAGYYWDIFMESWTAGDDPEWILAANVYGRYFYEESIYEGSYECHREDSDRIYFETIDEAVDYCYSQGLTEYSSGPGFHPGGWYSSPNGSEIIDYREAERLEQSFHPEGDDNVLEILWHRLNQK